MRGDRFGGTKIASAILDEEDANHVTRGIPQESEAELCALDIARDVYLHAETWARVIQEYLSQERFDGIAPCWKRKDGTAILVRASVRPGTRRKRADCLLRSDG